MSVDLTCIPRNSQAVVFRVFGIKLKTKEDAPLVLRASLSGLKLLGPAAIELNDDEFKNCYRWNTEFIFSMERHLPENFPNPLVCVEVLKTENNSSAEFRRSSFKEICIGKGWVPCSVKLSLKSHVQWYPILDEDKSEIGQIYIGVFPTIPKLLDGKKIAKRSGEKKKAWFKGKRPGKKKNKKRTQDELVEEFIDLVLYPGESGVDKEPFSGMLDLLELFKTEHGRVLFVNMIQEATPNRKRLEKLPFQTLLDVLRATLRESNGHRDFHTCKLVMDLSPLFTCDNKCLYTCLKDHQVFKSVAYYEMTFLEVCASERRANTNNSADAEDFDDEKVPGTKWHQLTDEERHDMRQKDKDLVITVVEIFASVMLNSGVKVSEVIIFVQKMAQMYDLDTGFFDNSCEFLKDLQNSIFGDLNIFVDELVAQSQLDDWYTKVPKDSENDTVWQSHETSGGVFYHNKITNTISQTRPSSFGGPAPTVEDLADFQGRHQEATPTAPMLRILSEHIKLLPGEIEVLKLNMVSHLTVIPHMLGTLCLTNYRLVFVPTTADAIEMSAENSKLFEVSVHTISHTETLRGTTPKFQCVHTIWCKDIRILRFGFNCEDRVMLNYEDLLKKYAFPGSEDQTFAFSYKEPFSMDVDGWNIYDPLKEYRRQKVIPPENGDTSEMHEKSVLKWYLSDVNSDYSLCKTYPRELILSTLLSEDEIKQAAEFRSKGRIPTLCYHYNRSGASILRSSQPLVGLMGGLTGGRGGPMDERLLRVCECKYILDARPKLNAVANSATGGGFENTDNNYTNCKLAFCGIENIHVMRESLSKLREACVPSINPYQGNQSPNVNNSDDNFLALVDASNWLKHLRQVIGAATRLTTVIAKEGENVLVHCSDGWDRTAQMTSLSQIMLDPYFRTLKGFQILVEKEWITFGHQFSRRHGHASVNYTDDQRSPIFLQFLDCVWQLTEQFPTKFEFNSYMLEFIADHVFSCKYGTFLYDHQFDRDENNLASRTVSLWSHITHEKDRRFLNHFYIRDHSVLYPDYRLRRFKVWHYYDRLNQKSESETIYKHASAYVSLQTAQSDTKIRWLTEKLEEEKKTSEELSATNDEYFITAREADKKYHESLAKQDKLFQEVVALNEQKKEFDRERHKSSKRQEMLFEEVLYLRQKMQKMQGSYQGVLSPTGNPEGGSRRKSRTNKSKSSGTHAISENFSGDISLIDPDRLKDLLHSTGSNSNSTPKRLRGRSASTEDSGRSISHRRSNSTSVTSRPRPRPSINANTSVSDSANGQSNTSLPPLSPDKGLRVYRQKHSNSSKSHTSTNPPERLTRPASLSNQLQGLIEEERERQIEEHSRRVDEQNTPRNRPPVRSKRSASKTKRAVPPPPPRNPNQTLLQDIRAKPGLRHVHALHKRSPSHQQLPQTSRRSSSSTPTSRRSSLNQASFIAGPTPRRDRKNAMSSSLSDSEDWPTSPLNRSATYYKPRRNSHAGSDRHSPVLRRNYKSRVPTQILSSRTTFPGRLHISPPTSNERRSIERRFHISPPNSNERPRLNIDSPNSRERRSAGSPQTPTLEEGSINLSTPTVGGTMQMATSVIPGRHHLKSIEKARTFSP